MLTLCIDLANDDLDRIHNFIEPIGCQPKEKIVRRALYRTLVSYAGNLSESSPVYKVARSLQCLSGGGGGDTG